MKTGSVSADRPLVRHTLAARECSWVEALLEEICSITGGRLVSCPQCASKSEQRYSGSIQLVTYSEYHNYPARSNMGEVRENFRLIPLNFV